MGMFIYRNYIIFHFHLFTKNIFKFIFKNTISFKIQLLLRKMVYCGDSNEETYVSDNEIRKYIMIE